jgi:hypothetical protein
MKFHQIADCEGDNMCRGICEKIREEFGSPFNPFEAFIKDVFGKCEICFRAGYCTISQCKEQEANEKQIIDHIVNSATLTARISNDLVVNFPSANPDDLPRVQKINTGIEKAIAKDVKNGLNAGTIEEVVPKVNNMVNNYLVNAYQVPAATAKEILNTNQKESANIPYYTTTAAEKLVQKTEDSIKKLDDNVEKLSEVEKLAKSGQVKKTKNEAAVLEKSLDKMEKKFANAEEKLEKQVDTLNEVASQVKDPKIVAEIQSTIQNVKTTEKAAHEAKAAIDKDKKQLKKLKK